MSYFKRSKESLGHTHQLVSVRVHRARGPLLARLSLVYDFVGGLLAPGPLAIVQVSLKRLLAQQEIYLSRTTGRGFFRALVYSEFPTSIPFS